jgi:hypothetical protein
MLRAQEEIVNKKTYDLGDFEAYDITGWANEVADCDNITISTIPFFLLEIAACLKDLLKLIRINFPMTSFQLNNMTTNIIHGLTPIKEIAPILPVSRNKGVKLTIQWIKNNNG